ncbi:TerB family tellurite resistance protein [Fulvivirgaceae bacterium BMA10]|uniref:TerB family tellurite resistance protein n=1 Tax=Splendidivirga corallicola TaxID=3051826 RepID=A0ABT8KQN5_9BACT|nr:TerB family tellurite resistance protein [Fulvivirgaceae bacterium BMA10]
MGLFSLFKKDSSSNDKSYLKQLLKVAMADGHEDEIETKFIQKVAGQFNITAEEVQEIRDNLHNITFSEPKTGKERFKMIFDLVWIMMIDGQIDVGEIHTCSRVAMKMGYEPEIIEQLVEAIKDNADEEQSPEETYERLLSSLV